jgi:hypothetical protein
MPLEISFLNKQIPRIIFALDATACARCGVRGLSSAHIFDTLGPMDYDHRTKLMILFDTVMCIGLRMHEFAGSLPKLAQKNSDPYESIAGGQEQMIAQSGGHPASKNFSQRQVVDFAIALESWASGAISSLGLDYGTIRQQVDNMGSYKGQQLAKLFDQVLRLSERVIAAAKVREPGKQFVPDSGREINS